MKVIVDNQIPYLEKALTALADEVIYLSGKDFTPEQVKDADALIIRTRTLCSRQLLEGSQVRFIATATIGYDHIDIDYCRQAGITWTNAPGCNASSVAQYLKASLILLAQKQEKPLTALCIGIIGVGNVGSKVAEVARSLGMRVLSNDLPRAEKEGEALFTPLSIIQKEADIISFHTPLNREGRFKTLHLADENFFHSTEKKPVIINTSRGEVIKTDALLEALRNGWVSDAVIDVWENEPEIDLSLLNSAFIGTPHIAGYSADGKANATRMSLQALCHFFHIESHFEINPPSPDETIIHSFSKEEAVLQIYNPLIDSRALKSAPQEFEHLRGNYRLRREETAYQCILLSSPEHPTR